MSKNEVADVGKKLTTSVGSSNAGGLKRRTRRMPSEAASCSSSSLIDGAGILTFHFLESG